MRVLVVLLLSLVVLPMFAVENVSVDPIAPTSRDRISFLIPVICATETASVDRVGNVFKVRLQINYTCDPPYRFAHVVAVDAVPAGTYRVEVLRVDTDEVYAEADFVVRNGEPKTFELHPSVVETDATFPPRIRITRADGEPLCALYGCTDIEIRIGGAKVVRPLSSDSERSVWFTPPARSATGFADLEIRRGDAIEAVQPAALYYYDDPQLSLFERVLFPVLTETKGLNDSHWISEAVIANPNPFLLSTASNISSVVCVTSPCGTERFGTHTYFPFPGEGFPRGAFLLVPRDEAGLLSYSLRVRDTSRVKDGFGTNVPVVREREMSRSRPLSLGDIPRDPRYRVKLRVYAVLPEGETQTLVGIRTVIDSRTYNNIQYDSLRLQGSGNPVVPAYGELDLPAGNANQRSLIFVDPQFDALTWAFITVTNNETQQVTIITPNGNGSPCPTCGIEP